MKDSRRPWQRSLRTRLTLLFAALGLAPAIMVGYSVLRNLTRSIDVWENPGVTDTMESVRMVARTSVNKLVSNLAVHARDLVDVVARTSDEDAEAELADFQRTTEVDLVGLYRALDDDWLPITIVCDDPVSFTADDIDLALQLTSLQTDEHGYLVSAFPYQTDDAHYAILLGYRLGPEYLPYLESIAAGLTYYSQLRLAKQATRQSAILTAVVVTLVALGLALFLGRKVARGVSRPVEDLVGGMQRLARGEVVQVTPKGTDELRFLSDTFNRMARELEVTRRELAKAERLAAWQEMARRIAHEIRNPLTPIQFALHRLSRKAARGESPEPVVITESVNAILEELDGLKTLAATFSEFAKLPDPEPSPIALNDLVESVAGLVESQGRLVHRELDPELPEIVGDRRGLRRVLTNLLKNALETGAETLTVRSRCVGPEGVRYSSEDARLGPGSTRSLLAVPHVVITVEDDGPGFASADLDSIFLPDYSTKPTGSGLGLAIVCRIIAQHGGVLVVERAADHGAKLHVHLPLEIPALDEAAGDRDADTL